MASTPCSTSALQAGAPNNVAKARRVFATWSILFSAFLQSPIHWKHHPNESTTAREEVETTEVKEGEDTGVEGRMATTLATSLVLLGGVSLESVARVETHGTSRADVIVAERQVGGALMTIWTATAVSWSVGVDGGIPVGTRAWMLLFRSSPCRNQKSVVADLGLASAWHVQLWL